MSPTDLILKHRSPNIAVTYYFARFERHGSDLFRLDTRIYLDDVSECTPQDCVIGAVVAKNPGSALPTNEAALGMQPIDLNRGMLLRTVRSIVIKAYTQSKQSWPTGAYVQVLNLFYLRDARFRSALKRISQVPEPPVDRAEQKVFPWTMYLWGRTDERIKRFTARFSTLIAPHHFYFDKNLNRLVFDRPDENSFAKHTQGLSQKPIVEYLATLVASET